jgi:hypothetical protein
MTVPVHTHVRHIWFSIGHGHDGVGGGRPIHEHPILMHRTEQFGAGPHRFDLTWQTPEQIGAMTSLTATYSGSFGGVGNEIAFFKPIVD